ncbi:MAG: sigma-54-dependent Fis family transcriptional regulator [Deltaproteobacteria bacterium CG_4_8_14_3_um_filter_45_9]|nr:MAG: sigma-54-dependent Fis family transcriptional regulator [Deltaproteobacteria bacterium CG_4_8_14_3_um_filter_45_9]
MESNNFNELQKKIEFYEAVLNNIHNGVVITDPDGKVIFFSRTYGNFLGIDPKEVIGKHCTEVIENSRMHLVAKTEIPEIDHPHRIMGQDMVVQRIPIKMGDRVIAVYGQVMFKDVRDVHTLARKLNLLESKVEFYEKELESLRSSKYTINNIVGKTEGIVELKKLALKAAATNAPVLLIGESGTGKELFAHAIHHSSERRRYPFIRLNCAAIPKDLLEAELFGYEPGAFTGAGSKGKPGKFELAHQGTIFLDEISDLPLEMQPKLLRVLEEKEMERLGGTLLTKCDFRLIAAANENLEGCVEDGKFRKDLYYRLNVIPIQIPPLRQRKEDIPIIAEHLIQILNKDLGTHVTKISHDVLNIFQNYDWPGNVRELANILERTIYITEGDTIQFRHLPFFLQSMREGPAKLQHTLLKNLREDMEKEALLHAIRISNDNKNKAAKLLGIHRTALYKKMKKLNIPISTI